MMEVETPYGRSWVYEDSIQLRPRRRSIGFYKQQNNSSSEVWFKPAPKFPVNLQRMATWVRLCSTSPKQRFKSSHFGPSEILPYDWTFCFWDQPLREITNKKRRGLISSGESHVHGKRGSAGSESPTRVRQGVTYGLRYARHSSGVPEEKGTQP